MSAILSMDFALAVHVVVWIAILARDAFRGRFPDYASRVSRASANAG
ncbi:hypothetical protein NSU_1903 [Novosphingobium pentaromativorans US6-1]|uniref:Uncharacterized protein n=1 Tax=Novosphingobium pentaromativorans US6-1 TaxID=1088721 RepID=G6EC32_9SPHN|nr:hypothetical protein NSU_1903 [Novosphingobium pentaromativorans US6-1]